MNVKNWSNAIEANSKHVRVGFKGKVMYAVSVILSIFSMTSAFGKNGKKTLVLTS